MVGEEADVSGNRSMCRACWQKTAKAGGKELALLGPSGCHWE